MFPSLQAHQIRPLSPPLDPDSKDTPSKPQCRYQQMFSTAYHQHRIHSCPFISPPPCSSPPAVHSRAPPFTPESVEITLRHCKQQIYIYRQGRLACAEDNQDSSIVAQFFLYIIHHSKYSFIILKRRVVSLENPQGFALAKQLHRGQTSTAVKPGWFPVLR
jgi:hypothetical protein